MSRVLSKLLDTDETTLAIKLRGLERASGLPRVDIRLISDVAATTRRKLQDLGFDPADTDGHELYNALKTKLLQNEMELRTQLGVETAPQDAVIESIQRLLGQQEKQHKVFALKQNALKRILKELKPKATMKALGYRSQDSMFKHESAAQLLAATIIAESQQWHTKRLQRYAKLQPSDFELRPIQCIAPVSKQWPAIVDAYTQLKKNHVVVLPEAGAIIMLPHKHELAAIAMISLVQAIKGINDIRTLSSYWKIHQVTNNFGDIVSNSLQEEPRIDAQHAGESLAWKIVHWFYGTKQAEGLPETFEPHVQQDDLRWYNIEEKLAKIYPSLGFWMDTSIIGHLDRQNAVVSFNIMDVAINVSNQLHYADRVVQNMQQQLSWECLCRYLHPDNLKQAVNLALSNRLLSTFDENFETV